MRALPFDLLAITDPGAPRGLAPYLEMLAADEPGWALVLRDHDANDAALEAALQTLLAARRQTPLLLAVGAPERITLATRAGVGMLLAERAPAVARGTSDAPLGASIHDLSGVARRGAQVDFLVLAPFGEVPGKGPPLRDEAVEAVTGVAPCPVFALGGLTDGSSVTRALSLGCAGIAVRSGFARAEDGAAALRDARRRLAHSRTERDRRARSG